ncbi:MAG: alpha-hydroxy-acid oxidizing protein [Burkholderiales bacterium]|nr:alpha-hydroxy-acid oxidizing protein [Burkholderiales bacterium]
MHDAHNIALLRAAAKKRLPRPIFDFADGGAENEHTLRENEAAFADWSFLPRPLEGAGTRDLSVELFGKRLRLPILIGPTGLAGLYWPRGEIAAARAAAAAGTVYCMSHGSVCSIEDLAAAHEGPRWMQVFIYRDRGFTRELTTRAQAAGFQALVLTIDNQLLGKRERDLVNGFAIPPRFGPRQWLDYARAASWWWAMRSELPRLTFGNYVRAGSSESVAGLAGRMAAMLDPAMNWDDVAALREAWRGPLLLKGVMHVHEARRALALGVDGVIVSNHGGRQLDGAQASLRALPAILDASGGQLTVLVDGGIRRGGDAAKALALGASAVLIGRPQLWGLAVAGEAGVAHVLELLRAELDRTMGLVGASDIGALRRLGILTNISRPTPR